MNAPRFSDVKPAMLAQVEKLCRELVPGGRKQSGYWMAKNPTRLDRNAGSFWVRLTEPAKGAWRDEATGDKGDVIKLVSYILGHEDNRQTLHWCNVWLGWTSGNIDRRAIKRQQEEAAAQQLKEEREAAQKLAEAQAAAFGLFVKAQAKIKNTLVDTYLQSRGIELARMRRQPGAIRFLPEHDHIGEDGEITTWPCMIVAVGDDTGKIKAVHRTWLQPDGSDKAPVPKPRKLWPGYKGLHVRIARGKGGLTPEEAARQGRPAQLVVTEGIEDALSVAIACPDYRVWAAGTLGNIANLPAHPCISKVIVCADNDWKTPQAIAQLETSIAALRGKGLRVSVARSWVGKDPNDLLKG